MNTKQIIDEMVRTLAARTWSADHKGTIVDFLDGVESVVYPAIRKLIEAVAEENKNKGLNYLSKELRKEVKELNKSLIQKMIDPIAHARKMDTIRFVQQRILVAKLIEKEQRLKVKEILSNLK